MSFLNEVGRYITRTEIRITQSIWEDNAIKLVPEEWLIIEIPAQTWRDILRDEDGDY